MVWRQASDLSDNREGDVHRFSTTVSTPVDIDIFEDRIALVAGPLTRSWKSTEISYVLTQKVPDSRPSQWSLFVDTKDAGMVEILRSFNELHILKMAESIAVSCDARLAEHTGRRVREDEHGMNLITQLNEFGERWSAPVPLDGIRFSFKQKNGGYNTRLPTELEDGALAGLIWSCFGAIVLGLMITLATVRTADVFLALSWSLGLTVLTILVWAKLEGPTGSLDNRHNITLTRHTITIKSNLFGLFPRVIGQWPLANLLDLDCNDQGEVTFLLNERRVRMRLLRPEAEYLVASFGQAIRDMGLAEGSSEEE